MIRNGFSLFEMLIALSIMALLGSFVIPNIKKIQNKSYSIASEVNLKTFQSSLENYYLDNSNYPLGSINSSELFTILKNYNIMKTSPINPYYKKAYSSTDSKGKILYSSSDGEEYAITLYDMTGLAIQLELNSL